MALIGIITEVWNFSVRAWCHSSDGVESVGEAAKVRVSCGCGESGSVIWRPEVGIRSTDC